MVLSLFPHASKGLKSVILILERCYNFRIKSRVTERPYSMKTYVFRSPSFHERKLFRLNVSAFTFHHVNVRTSIFMYIVFLKYTGVLVYFSPGAMNSAPCFSPSNIGRSMGGGGGQVANAGHTNMIGL